MRALLCKPHLCLVILVSAYACGSNKPASPWWETTATAPSPVSASSRSPLLHLLIEPPGVNGGGTVLGTASLSHPAPAGGVPVMLSSSNGAAQVPPSVIVAGGATTVGFNIRTQTVSSDVHAEILASSPGLSARASVDVWAILPMSFSYELDPASVFGERIGRYTSANGSFFACQNGSDIIVQVRRPDRTFAGSVHLGVPRGAVFGPGTYEGATEARFRAPSESGIDVIITGGCGGRRTGRFVVSEAALGSSFDVRRLVVTFDQRCGDTGAIRGELRLAAPAPYIASGTTCPLPGVPVR